MPIRNHFPIFHKLKQGAYCYVWTDKCEKLLPKHYKNRCLEYMLREPTPVHWIPDPQKYRYDKYGQLVKVQNHPIRVRFPEQCNKGLWAGEGVVQCFVKPTTGKRYIDLFMPRVPKVYAPNLFRRRLYSEILDEWFNIPCTNRAMDLIDDSFGLDYYILQNHERDLNSKLAMDLQREMLVKLATESQESKLSPERQRVFNRYKQFMIPYEEAEWVGLSIQEALEKAEAQQSVTLKVPPLKYRLAEIYRQGYMDSKLNPKTDKKAKKKPQLRLKDVSKTLKSYISGS
ncbi:39S ribosomal protein L28, mitochondrial-like [Mya arenaria]|uniref:39S ribosomal protein L28, mitochondrial-like n=1 Tax=Mya arenaria TaxID=6604 RepID=UPI0022E3668A|nr:39S ribosomal protein L28, mitochondrial-like [Mya arenaria]XP_052797231.1 39S ribosomal protein L28, mitochondrial-like [Mya arenaria]